jgi:hypothetical protein
MKMNAWLAIIIITGFTTCIACNQEGRNNIKPENDKPIVLPDSVTMRDSSAIKPDTAHIKVYD